MNAPIKLEQLQRASHYRRRYVPIRWKFAIAVCVAISWTLLSVYLANPWREDLGALTNPFVALWALTFIAFVPGFMNAFLATSLLLDKRPPRRKPPAYPGVSILIAAYNEEAGIHATLSSVASLNYEGAVEAIVINDGSTDATVEHVKAAQAMVDFPANLSVRLLDFQENRGKAAALNSGLEDATHELICTIDGDSRLRSDSLKEIVERLLSDPPGTVAVAGAVLVRNSRATLITAAQEWDYFHGISAVKRMQSMYHGTLVAQGAFSLYRKSALQEVGGWPNSVGEDIVMTWALLERGHRVGFAEDAIVFTDAPTSFGQFYRQRKRWSRGLIEALQRHHKLLFKPRLSTLFVWWNLLFLPLDLTFTLVFIPGLVAALFGYFWIAGTPDTPSAPTGHRLERSNLQNPETDVPGARAKGTAERCRSALLHSFLRNRHAAGLPLGVYFGAHGTAEEMGHEVMRWGEAILAAGISLVTAASPAVAASDTSEDSPHESSSFAPAIGVELWSSTDTDKTDVVKLMGRALWKLNGRDHYQGIAVEQAYFRPQGEPTLRSQRVYLDLADDIGKKWLWRARVGIDERTVLGSASIRTADWSKEFFVERELVETPRGVSEGIYYTFAGASLDVLDGKRDVLNTMIGIQTFTGKNERLHLRGSYIHVLKRDIGLSAQLRGRYFHSTRPGEFDYYSPRDFVQILPVLQMRRFDRAGWMYLAAVGYGAQKATSGPWQHARLLDLRVSSPAASGKLQAFGSDTILERVTEQRVQQLWLPFGSRGAGDAVLNLPPIRSEHTQRPQKQGPQEQRRKQDRPGGDVTRKPLFQFRCWRKLFGFKLDSSLFRSGYFVRALIHQVPLYSG